VGSITQGALRGFAATRPWAAEFNAFGVKTVTANPFLHPDQRRSAGAAREPPFFAAAKERALDTLATIGVSDGWSISRLTAMALRSGAGQNSVRSRSLLVVWRLRLPERTIVKRSNLRSQEW
jgi:hypothetical protein